mmetsp:Transcript_9865/g.60096  ORF Transcript_9865/g.60096 Transcript_9865/m.60096 type:complete len:99 (+) Transcript_9865:270-566(+)
MKFGKLLRNTAEAQPEWADAYLDYKLLKKKLKALKRNEDDTGETRRKEKKACGNVERRRANRDVPRNQPRRTDVRCGERTPNDAHATNDVEAGARERG